jgi:hypothetical protein
VEGEDKMIYDPLPDEPFGKIPDSLPPDNSPDDEDEPLSETPWDVIALIGFDPLEDETRESIVSNESDEFDESTTATESNLHEAAPDWYTDDMKKERKEHKGRARRGERHVDHGKFSHAGDETHGDKTKTTWTSPGGHKVEFTRTHDGKQSKVVQTIKHSNGKETTFTAHRGTARSSANFLHGHYNINQPRDAKGRWTATGAGVGGKTVRPPWTPPIEEPPKGEEPGKKKGLTAGSSWPTGPATKDEIHKYLKFAVDPKDKADLDWHVREVAHAFEDAKLDRTFLRIGPMNISINRKECDAFRADGLFSSSKIILHNKDVSAGTLAHEYGHYIEYTWVPLSPFYHGPGNPDLAKLIDSAKMAESHKAMVKEYEESKQGNVSLFGQNTPVLISPPDAPSGYALRSGREWFAESFKKYTHNDASRELLKEKCPATYKFMDLLVHGKFFRKEDK